MRYRTILIDPPWTETTIGKFSKHQRADKLNYPTMTLEQIKALPINELADSNSHLWLWTTNRSLPDAFSLVEGWGFRYLAPIHWIKPSGFGAWWIHRSQTLLFAYKGKCEFVSRYKPNLIFAPSRKHSEKPQQAHTLIEQVSFPERLELFARATRQGWTTLGNEIDGKDIHEAIKALPSQSTS